MKNLFKVVTVFATLALLVGAMVALSVSAAEGDLGDTDATATATAAETSEIAEPTATEATVTGNGDANGDGAVNMKDVLIVRKYLADIEVEINLDAVDTNLDGEVNLKDVLNLRKFLADIVTELPVASDAEPTATAA